MSVIHNGTSSAGDTQSITLAKNASNVDNAYKGMQITLTDGSCATQIGTIASYRGSTRVATVDKPWAANELAHSEDVSNSSWNVSSAIIVSTDVMANPEGQMRADLVIATTTNVTHFFDNNLVTLSQNTDYVASMRVMASGLNFARIQIKRLDAVFNENWFNLSTGAVGTTLVTTQSVASIAPLGGGWFLCAVAFNSLTGTAIDSRVVYHVSSTDAVGAFAGDNVAGVLFGGVQLRKANTATTYIFTPGGPELTPDSSTAYSISMADGFKPQTSSNAFRQLSDGSNQGTILGRTTVDPIGFYGAVPVNQPSGATSVVPITASTLSLSSVLTGSTGGVGFSTAALFNAFLSTVAFLKTDVVALSAALNPLHVAASSTGLTAGA